MFTRLAVAHRGEPAVRVLRAVHELNDAQGYDIRVIALHTEAERHAAFVRAAHEAICLSPTPAVARPDLDHGHLGHDELARALRESRADAAWGGGGSLAEDLAFAELCEELGVASVGPPPAVMRRFGDRIRAKRLAQEVGVPVLPGSEGPVDDPTGAVHHAETLGYPLVVKARSGTGSGGIRVVRSPDDLVPALERTREEATRATRDPAVYLEQCVVGGRLIEVQLLADHHGTIWTPGVRDCSLQRDDQTLLEESASPILDAEAVADLRAAARALAEATGYRGAGTVRFLYRPHDRTFAFLEVTCRSQLEHPVTEVTTGLDLAKQQLLVAAGHRLAGRPPSERGHAVEVRLDAQGAEHGSAPASGAVELLRLPSGPGVRVDTAIATGDAVAAGADPLLAKVIAWGHDREEALARLRCALRETTVVLRGGTTTRSSLLALLSHPDVVSGVADTGWVERVGMPTSPAAARGDVALLSAAIDVYEAEEARERDAFLRSAHGGRPRADHAIGRTIELGYQGATYPLTVGQVSPHRYRIDVGGEPIDVELDRYSEYEHHLVIADRRFQVVAVAGPADHLVEVDGITHRILRDEAGVVRAPSPAVVVSLPAGRGDEVEAGAPVAVLESMKMETAVRAPYTGRVKEVLATVNSQVDAGAPLLRLDRLLADAPPTHAPRVVFDHPATTTEDVAVRARQHLDALQAMVTGYDVSPTRARTLVGEYVDLRGPVADDDAELLHAELGLLTTFADLWELIRNRPTDEEETAEEPVHTPREHFHTYLRSLDVEREGLPETFRAKLLRALRHYGVDELRPGPELQEAVYRVFLAQERATQHVPVVAALLERWLADAEQLDDPDLRRELGVVLDRLIVATQLRYPSIGDLARSVRFRAFDQPLIRQAREESHSEARALLRLLDEHPDSPERAQWIDALVASPEPLVRLLAQRVTRGSTGLGPILEVLTRRYYKVRTLEHLRSFARDGRPFVTGEFDLAGQRLHLLSTVAEVDELRPALASIGDLAADVDAPANLVVDLYVAWSDPPTDTDELSAQLLGVLQDVAWLRTGRRVTVTVCGEGGEQVDHLTYRPGPAGLAEERVIRGMHPLTGQRLDLWRLKEFDGTRLPSPEDTYLFHLVAPDNPDDERVVALADVRDVTPLRDPEGQVVAFPAVERTLAACLDGIRQFQARRGARRLDANRIFLYVWPPIDVPLDELARFARTLAPLTASAGLEEIMVLARLQAPSDQAARAVALRFSYQPGAGVDVTVTEPPTEPLAPLDEYTQKVQRSRARGTVYPYELIPLLTRGTGTFTEHDLDDDGRLRPVDRPPGRNTAGIIVGLVTTPTDRYPEGVTRVALFGDPTKALGSVAEPECARVIAALDLAEAESIPVEWFALSSGARISMDSGTENMDWVARALRRLITFTQAGGEVNVVSAGINVGAQPYWNAEATMLLHTRGILIMTPDSAMVLTGKHSLDYSGGVSAEDNFGIGGYDRVMGPNGQAQYWAPNLAAACDVLFSYYEHAYVAPGERFPRRAATSDPDDRDVRDFPHAHPASDFTTVGDIFSAQANAERKRPFDIRTVMRAVGDQDHPLLERWATMADADTSVVVDAHLGGRPVSMLGIESRPIPRRGAVPADGPDQWTAGTLFPRSSKKAARAINAASGNRPLVVLANLSGFDGSPESLRNLQLEYGAEIGRAMVNFDGPIVFCVISRYHGGAFVVFSGVLNDNMEVLAVEGSYASVIGGAPAAAVVFAREVNTRTAADPRIRALETSLAATPDEGEQARLRVELDHLRSTVRSEKLGEVGEEFERVHDIARAQRVGSVHAIVPARELRPRLIAAVERGIQRATTAVDDPAES